MPIPPYRSDNPSPARQRRRVILPDAQHPILLAEHDPALRGTIREALEEHGLPVEEVADGWTALERAALRRPALVVLGWELPRLSGAEVVAGLRAAFGDGVPIVIVGLQAPDRADGASGCAAARVPRPDDVDEVLFAVWSGLGVS